VQETGFRSTGTCQNPAMDSTATTALDARVERVCRHLQASLDEPSLQELADIAGCSPTRLHRLFKQATGLTPSSTPPRCAPTACAPGWNNRSASPMPSTMPASVPAGASTRTHRSCWA
jgi:methylphosphotriester-DNA--protein-cysteine methyltransferase